MFEKYENLFIVEDGDRGPTIERTFAKTEDELVGMNQDPYPVKIWNASGQIAHLPTRDGGSLDVIPNSTIADFIHLTPDQVKELEWGIVIIDNNSQWDEVKNQVQDLINDMMIVFLRPDGTEANLAKVDTKESFASGLELYNDKYGLDIAEIIDNLNVKHDLNNPDLSVKNLANVIRTHTIQTIVKDGKSYVFVGLGDTYMIAEVKEEGSAEKIAKSALNMDLGLELIKEVI